MIPRALTSCPACGRTHTRQLGGVASSFAVDGAGHPLLHPEYAAMSCPECGLVFKSQTPPKEQLAEYYEQLNFDPFDLDMAFPTDMIARRELALLPQGSAILDFGCSTGRLLRTMTLSYQCLGIEPNDAAAAVARQRGFRICTQSDLHDNQLDAIVLSDVYEHLTEPVEVLLQLASRLRFNGIMIVITGAADAIPKHHYLMSEYWYFRAFGHLHMVSERHLEWLAKRTGLTLEKCYRCSHYATPLADQVRQWARSFIYHQFKRRTAALNALLRRIPVIRRGEEWPNAPALTCPRDHVVAVFRKVAIA